MRLSDKRREQVVDLLGERLAFERSMVRLYDRTMEALRLSSDGAIRDLLVPMQRHRAEEDEHARWLEERIRELGEDALAGGDLAQVVTREARGIADVVENDAADLRRLLHALLAAEAVDHAGWDLLFRLATDARDHDSLRELGVRRLHEQQHLARMREAIQQHAIRRTRPRLAARARRAEAARAAAPRPHARGDPAARHPDAVRGGLGGGARLRPGAVRAGVTRAHAPPRGERPATARPSGRRERRSPAVPRRRAVRSFPAR